jgi:hypothetical protein
MISHTILLIWPRRTTTCSMDWRNKWNFANFRPTPRSLLPWRPDWTDKLLISFLFFCSWLAKVTATG